MKDDERDLIRRWVDTWRDAGRELEAIGLEESADASVQDAIRSFSQAWNRSWWRLPQPLPATGYKGRIADAAGFARRNRVLLITAPNGVPVDIALAALPFEAQAIARDAFRIRAGRRTTWPVARLAICAGEPWSVGGSQ